MTARGAPISDAERADVLDALRGFALLGIFLSHVPDFSGFTFMSDVERAAGDRLGANELLDAALHFFIQGKFVSLFSLLFGIGFAVQLESAVRGSRNFARHFARRQAILLIIGLTHALIWYGDILKDYALIGLALIITARWTPAAVGLAAAAVLCLRVVWPLIMWAVLADTAPLATGADPAGRFSALAQTFAGADPIATFAANMELLRIKALQMLYDGKAVSILGMFLLGAYIGKLRLYRDLQTHSGLLGRVFVTCAPLGVIGNGLLAALGPVTPTFPPSPIWVAEQTLAAVAVPLMTLAYAAGFAWLWSKHDGSRLRTMAPAGRMALTTYVSQTLVGVIVFYGIGLGLHGSADLAICIAFALAVFVLQCATAALWLKHFRFGPLEWLWRRTTYGTPLPMLRRTQAVMADPPPTNDSPPPRQPNSSAV